MCKQRARRPLLNPSASIQRMCHHYAQQMGQPTQRATNYTARSNIEPAQIFLHANVQSAPRSGGARNVGRSAGSHTPSTASESFSQRDIGIDPYIYTYIYVCIHIQRRFPLYHRTHLLRNRIDTYIYTNIYGCTQIQRRCPVYH